MRRAVFLERQVDRDNTLSFRVVMWFPVPEAKRYLYLNPRFVSALHGELKPSFDELSLLRAGAIREVVTSVSAEKFTNEHSPRLRTGQELLAEIRRATEAQYLAELNRQSGAEITASLYGTTYDDAIPGGWKLVLDTT